MSLSIGSPTPRPGPGRLQGPGGRPAKKPSRRTTQVRRNAFVMAWLLAAAVLAGLLAGTAGVWRIGGVVGVAAILVFMVLTLGRVLTSGSIRKPVRTRRPAAAVASGSTTSQAGGGPA